MSKSMKHPERFLGLHFFNPANRMPLVEVVPGKETKPEVLATAVEACKKLGKTPIIVGDCPGFLVNRIFVLGANEVMWLFQEGVPMERLEKLMLDFGMPMSPFELGDEVGNDVSFHVSKSFEAAYGPRMQPPKIMDAMYENKLYGKKVGKGFYIYRGKQKSPNPELRKFVLSDKSKNLDDQEIMDRITFLMINESALCLDQNIVSKPEYLDMAMILGTGFPPFRGEFFIMQMIEGFQQLWKGLISLQRRTKSALNHASAYCKWIENTKSSIVDIYHIDTESAE